MKVYKFYEKEYCSNKYTFENYLFHNNFLYELIIKINYLQALKVLKTISDDIVRILSVKQTKYNKIKYFIFRKSTVKSCIIN